MAADSAAKRLSAMEVGMPNGALAVLPSGTVDAPERAAALELYAGLPGAAPPSATGDSTIWLRRRRHK